MLSRATKSNIRKRSEKRREESGLALADKDVGVVQDAQPQPEPKEPRHGDPVYA